MKNDQQSSQQGSQRTQSELETVIRQGQWGSQADANSYLQQHGLSAKMQDDGTTEIFDTQNSNNRVATVKFDRKGGSISGIEY